MGWTKLEEGGIARELHQRRDDVYPELSQIGLDNEPALKTLADEPEHLDEDDWDQLEECGRLAQVYQVDRVIWPIWAYFGLLVPVSY